MGKSVQEVVEEELTDLQKLEHLLKKVVSNNQLSKK